MSTFTLIVFLFSLTPTGQKSCLWCYHFVQYGSVMRRKCPRVATQGPGFESRQLLLLLSSSGKDVHACASEHNRSRGCPHSGKATPPRVVTLPGREAQFFPYRYDVPLGVCPDIFAVNVRVRHSIVVFWVSVFACRYDLDELKHDNSPYVPRRRTTEDEVNDFLNQSQFEEPSAPPEPV